MDHSFAAGILDRRRRRERQNSGITAHAGQPVWSWPMVQRASGAWLRARASGHKKGSPISQTLCKNSIYMKICQLENAICPLSAPVRGSRGGLPKSGKIGAAGPTPLHKY